MKKTNETKYVTYVDAVKHFWKGYLQFKGKTRRSGYWWAILANAIFIYGLLFLFSSLVYLTENMIIAIVAVITLLVIELALFIPNLAMLTRRLQDAGSSFGVSLTMTLTFTVLTFVTMFSKHNIILIGYLVFSIWMFVLTLIPSEIDRIKK